MADWTFYALLGAAGAIGGLVFWLIRRPDRDGKSSVDTTSERPDPLPHD